MIMKRFLINICFLALLPFSVTAQIVTDSLGTDSVLSSKSLEMERHLQEDSLTIAALNEKNSPLRSSPRPPQPCLDVFAAEFLPFPICRQHRTSQFGCRLALWQTSPMGNRLYVWLCALL